MTDDGLSCSASRRRATRPASASSAATAAPELLANEVASSVDEHARFGGVVPEVASPGAPAGDGAHRAPGAGDRRGRRPRRRRRRGHRRAGAGRRAARRGRRGEGLRRGLGRAALRREPPRRARRRRHPAARPAARRAWRCWSPAGTRSLLDVPDVAGPGHAAGRHDRRRGRRGVRQGGPAARAAVPRRPAHRPGGPRRRPGRDRVPARAHRPARRGRSTSPSPASRPRSRGTSRRWSGRATPVPVADVAASFQEAVVDVLTAQGGARRPASAGWTRCCSAAGSRPTRGCGRWPRSGAPPPGSPCGCRGRGCAPTTARWWPRWARTCVGRRRQAVPARTCRPTRRCRSPRCWSGLAAGPGAGGPPRCARTRPAHAAALRARTSAAARPGRGRPCGSRRRRSARRARSGPASCSDGLPDQPAQRGRERATAARAAVRPSRTTARNGSVGGQARPQAARTAGRRRPSTRGQQRPARRASRSAARGDVGRSQRRFRGEPLVVEPRAQRVEIGQPLDRHLPVGVAARGQQVQPRRARVEPVFRVHRRTL